MNNLTRDNLDHLLDHFCEAPFDSSQTGKLAERIALSGQRLTWPTDLPTVDMASTGGIGNKTPITVPILALAAAKGSLRIPKISTRGAYGGTIDLLESAGCRTDHPIEQFQANVREFGLGCLPPSDWLAPLDRALMQRRRERGLMSNAALVVSSILGKKIAVGCRNVLIDVKTGPHSKFGSVEATLEGARLFCEVGELLRKKGYFDSIHAVLTNDFELQGSVIGRRLSIRESVAVLQGESTPLLSDLSHFLAARMLLAGGVVQTLDAAEKAIAQACGKDALAIFNEFIRRQGGAADATKPQIAGPSLDALAILASSAGVVSHLDVGLLARLLKPAMGDASLPGYFQAGVEIAAPVGTAVRSGDTLARVYGVAETGAPAAAFEAAFYFADPAEPVAKRPAILGEAVWSRQSVMELRSCWNRTSRSAAGFLSRHISEGEVEFLLRFNRKWSSWNLIAGHIEDRDSSPEQTMAREFLEETGPEAESICCFAPDDLALSRLLSAPYQDVYFSKAAGQNTLYEFYPFHILLKRGQPQIDRLTSRLPNLFRWFSLKEIVAGRSRSGDCPVATFPLHPLIAAIGRERLKDL